MDALNSKFDDNNQAIREELNTALIKISQKMDEMNNRKWREERKVSKDKNMEQMSPEPENNEKGKDDDNSEIGDASNDETMEELSLQSEDTGKQIENKEDSKALVPEDTHHRNEENIQHKEAIIKNVKNKVIKKTGEKETKIKRIIPVSYTHLDVYKRQP